MFEFPKQAFFGRTVPKNKIYEKTRVSSSLRQKFVKQIDKIVWQYKLSPETVNLPSRKSVPEIEVFTIQLREADLREEILRTIDNAIPFPIIYELVFDGKVKTKAAFKRPSGADSSKWVTDIYFESGWHKIDAKRKPLPVALDLARLYEQLLRELMPTAPISGEQIAEQVARLGQIRSKQFEADKLESRMRKEKQFNRKVELNVELRKLKNQIEELTTETQRALS